MLQNKGLNDTKDEDKDKDKDKYKCNNCGYIFSEDSFGINLYTEQVYTTCIFCREKQREKYDKQQQEKRIIKQEEIKIKKQQLDELRENLLNQDRILQYVMGFLWNRINTQKILELIKESINYIEYVFLVGVLKIHR